jgi:hypothetical protein
MDRTGFWRLIEETHAQCGGDCDRQVELLEERLKAQPEEQIIAFKQILGGLQKESYTWELWAAAYLINGGCSDDGFDYFRSWLIAQGEAIFTAALKDPGTLADFPDEFPEYAECEELDYVAARAHEAKTGRELPDHAYVRSGAREPSGEPWEEESVATLYPRLAARVDWQEAA